MIIRCLASVMPLLFIAACTPHGRCVGGYVVGGAAVAGLGLGVGAMQTSCNGDCMQHKIVMCESGSETVHHSARHRNDIITYGSLAAVHIGAGIGFLAGEMMCASDEPTL